MARQQLFNLRDRRPLCLDFSKYFVNFSEGMDCRKDAIAKEAQQWALSPSPDPSLYSRLGLSLRLILNPGQYPFLIPMGDRNRNAESVT